VYFRRNLFPTGNRSRCPPTNPVLTTTLNKKIGFYAQQATTDADAVVYAFGEEWGPEPGKPDQYFHFLNRPASGSI